MDKLKAMLKSILFGLIMLLFLALGAIIAKALDLSANRAYIFKGCFMLLSLIVPLLYTGSKKIDFSEIGFNKPNAKIMKGLAFYIPLIFALIPFVIIFNKNLGIKSMIVILFYYGCVAIAAEVYFRGVIQHLLRGKLKIIPMLFFVCFLYAICNMYYLYTVKSIKHILILCVGSFAICGLTATIIEKKGLILFNIIFNALCLFIGSNYKASGKKLIVIYFIFCVIVFVYWIYLFITYMKANKKEQIENKETFDEDGNIVLE